jgi:hypothetical protein
VLTNEQINAFNSFPGSVEEIKNSIAMAFDDGQGRFMRTHVILEDIQDELQLSQLLVYLFEFVTSMSGAFHERGNTE